MLRKALFLSILITLWALSASHPGSVARADEEGVILDKAKKLRKAVKRTLVPEVRGMGVSVTGQSKSYAPGDDGDMQRGVPWPEPRFVDHGDGTVTDRSTGLMWTKNARQLPDAATWRNALDACDSLVYAGYDNWRMPNLREILSLINYGAYGPALPEGHPFTQIEGDHSFWSSTTALPHTAQAWRVDLASGKASRNNKSGSLYYAWPVRRGRYNIR